MLCSTVGAAWVIALAVSGSRLWRYDSVAGAAAAPPMTLPAVAGISRTNTMPTLVMLVHPQCPCSRASIEELSKLMTRCQGRVSAKVLMIRPSGVAEGWEKTGLWRSAAAIPGVTVEIDEQGRAARLFGAATSGQTILYAASGELLFSGGITESRGHIGDNAGRSAIESFVLEQRPPQTPASTAVFGCPLFSPTNDCEKQGSASCQK
jgi:hypothetical protein